MKIMVILCANSVIILVKNVIGEIILAVNHALKMQTEVIILNMMVHALVLKDILIMEVQFV